MGGARDYSMQIKKKSSKNIIWGALLLLGVAVIYILFSHQLSKQEKMVTVVMAARNLTAGSIVNINEDLVPYEIAQSEYEKLNILKNANTGEKLADVVTAEYVNQADGLYVSNYTPSGTILRFDMLTNETVTSNPWIQNIPKDDGKSWEIYKMPFSDDDLNQRLLLPGSVIRVRAVMDIDNAHVEELRRQIEQKESPLDSGSRMPQDKISIMRTFAPTVKNTETENSALNSSTPVAEIITDIQVVDMLNNSGESVLDIYMALLSLPLEKRVAMLKTSVNETSNEFVNRVKGNALVLVLTRQQASMFAELENMSGVTFKYTLLPPNSNGDLYNQLTTVSDNIYSFAENYKVTQD